MKPNLLVLLVIQLVYFGEFIGYSNGFINVSFLFPSRLAFLPIYFTAYETGRHQVFETIQFYPNARISSFSGTHRDALCYHLIMCNSGISLYVFSKSVHNIDSSREEYATREAIKSTSPLYKIRFANSSEYRISLES